MGAICPWPGSCLPLDVNQLCVTGAILLEDDGHHITSQDCQTAGFCETDIYLSVIVLSIGDYDWLQPNLKRLHDFFDISTVYSIDPVTLSLKSTAFLPLALQ